MIKNKFLANPPTVGGSKIEIGGDCQSYDICLGGSFCQDGICSCPRGSVAFEDECQERQSPTVAALPGIINQFYRNPNPLSSHYFVSGGGQVSFARLRSDVWTTQSAMIAFVCVCPGFSL